MFSETDEAGIGVIVHDHNRLIIAALSQRIHFPGTVVVVEALTARRAVTLPKKSEHGQGV
jgi:hypothetical protein